MTEEAGRHRNHQRGDDRRSDLGARNEHIYRSSHAPCSPSEHRFRSVRYDVLPFKNLPSIRSQTGLAIACRLEFSLESRGRTQRDTAAKFPQSRRYTKRRKMQCTRTPQRIERGLSRIALAQRCGRPQPIAPSAGWSRKACRRPHRGRTSSAAHEAPDRRRDIVASTLPRISFDREASSVSSKP